MPQSSSHQIGLERTEVRSTETSRSSPSREMNHQFHGHNIAALLVFKKKAFFCQKKTSRSHSKALSMTVRLSRDNVFKTKKATVIEYFKQTENSYGLPSKKHHVRRCGTFVLTNTERDLGVAIDNHRNFKLHISQTVSQANRLLGMTCRSFEHLDQKTFLYLYKGLIRPSWNTHRLFGTCIFREVSMQSKQSRDGQPNLFLIQRTTQEAKSDHSLMPKS